MLDRLDRAILKILSSRARITNSDMAAEVGLSPTACAKRVQQMEAAGLIAGYRAVAGLEALGFGATVLVTITLDRQTEGVLEGFEKAIAACPSVLWCYLMAGTSDYLACVLARGIKDYERIHKEQLSRLPGVSSLQSNFVLRRVVERSMPEEI